MTELDAVPAVARRTLVGAAWSVPVVAVAVGAPQAVASGVASTAELTWVDPPGVQQESSLLLLRLQAGSPGAPVVAGTGTLTLTVLEDYAFEPASSVTAPPGWAVIESGRTITIVAPEDVTAGAKGFTVSWGQLSGNWTTTATWTESGASGSVSTSIEVGPRGFPRLDWTTNPAVYGGTSTLRLSVPSISYAIGYDALLILSPELPADTTIALPAGWTVSGQTIEGRKVLLGPSTTAGIVDFGFTFGAGSTPVTITPQWLSPAAPGSTPISPRIPLTLAPA